MCYVIDVGPARRLHNDAWTQLNRIAPFDLIKEGGKMMNPKLKVWDGGWAVD